MNCMARSISQSWIWNLGTIKSEWPPQISTRLRSGLIRGTTNSWLCLSDYWMLQQPSKQWWMIFLDPICESQFWYFSMISLHTVRIGDPTYSIWSMHLESYKSINFMSIARNALLKDDQLSIYHLRHIISKKGVEMNPGKYLQSWDG